MNDKPEKGLEPKKKPYEKPQLKQVLLKPEEAVLGACKNAGFTGPAQAKCNAPVPCNSLAS